MEKIQGIVATTRADLHGEKFPREELETIACQMREEYIPVTYEHDIRNAPIGRIVSAEVIKLEDGEYALQCISELFSESESLETLTGDGRRIRTMDQDIKTIFVKYDRYDRTLWNKEGQELLRELSQISGEKEEPEELFKHSLGPVPTILICVGVFAAGQIAKEFFTKLGSDAYDKLKNAFSKYFRRKISSEQILDFCFSVRQYSTTFEVHVLVVNPSEQKLNELFASKFTGLDELLGSISLSESDVAKVVLEYENRTLTMRYAVRSDCVPLKFVRAQKKENNGV